ncbi:MAG: cupin domain-containing protein [Myxococcales bacterium]|nr:cupin domain-containing protein [Myxococcales bacterium]
MSDESFDEHVLDFLAGGLRPLAMPTGLRDRLLSTASGRNRLLPFLDRMMALFDLPEGEAQGHLHSVDDDEAWEDMLPGVRFRDFDGGPALGDAHGGLVRLQPGEAFPRHTHVGEERVLVLQGELVDDQGQHYRAGDLLVSADGTSHELRAEGDREAVYAAVVTALVITTPDDDDDDDDE